MRIVSWNIYRHNPQLSRQLTWIREHAVDVVCLQEFPEAHLGLLDTLEEYPYRHSAREFFLKKGDRADIRLYTVTLARRELLGAGSIGHHPFPRMPLRYRLAYTDLDIQFQYVDLIGPYGRRFRIFNCHFECVTSPEIRLKRFQQVLDTFHPEAINIICGDFNNFGHPWVNLPMSWLSSHYSLKDLWQDEKIAFEKAFTEAGLVNVFRGQRTFRKFPFQLDYVLVPQHLSIRRHAVLKPPRGSDHFPVLLELER
ncbi:MAG: endonuclease/exonuclease/phosphatase family protein [Opitutales bacterium]